MDQWSTGCVTEPRRDPSLLLGDEAPFRAHLGRHRHLQPHGSPWPMECTCISLTTACYSQHLSKKGVGQTRREETQGRTREVQGGNGRMGQVPAMHLPPSGSGAPLPGIGKENQGEHHSIGEPWGQPLRKSRVPLVGLVGEGHSRCQTTWATCWGLAHWMQCVCQGRGGRRE